MGEVHRQRTCIGTDIPSSQDRGRSFINFAALFLTLIFGKLRFKSEEDALFVA